MLVPLRVNLGVLKIDFPKVEPIQPEPAQDILEPEKYPGEEPELAPTLAQIILQHAPANMNGWIKWDVPLDNLGDVPAGNPKDKEVEEEDPEMEEEEEEMDMDTDEEWDGLE
ncbi:hypothetical protein Tco_0453718 [Tanacetum coccineum]